MSPPRPPSPPEGGPKGLNFSLWKAAHPFPPVPGLTIQSLKKIAMRNEVDNIPARTVTITLSR